MTDPWDLYIYPHLPDFSSNLVGQSTIPMNPMGYGICFRMLLEIWQKNHATPQPGTQIGRSGGLGFSRSSGAVLSLFYLEPFTSRLSVTRVPSFRMGKVSC